MNITAQTYTIDAAGKTIGRIASEAAKALMGKTSPDYTPNKRSDVKVVVNNSSKIYTRERKRQQKVYTTYSGYPGGLKTETLASLAGRKGTGEAVRRAVSRMIPRNTMHTARMKNLTINA
jgi:large subunit ribosomal protein L13